jgi:NAD(P)H-hydrate epimerase
MEWQAVLVLKGAHTVVALPDGEFYINPTGNSVLSTAGTGDLLTGLISALAAQGLDVEKAAICGTYLHGLAADMLAARLGRRGCKAGDILDFFPAALNETVETPPAEPGEHYAVKPFL